MDRRSRKGRKMGMSWNFGREMREKMGGSNLVLLFRERKKKGHSILIKNGV